MQVVDQEGVNHGELSKADAIKMAQEAGLDLFIISKNTPVPIAKILDYGKHKFQEEKKTKLTKKKQSNLGEVKELKMGINIDIGDYNTRHKHAVKFLELQKKVKLNIMLKGREMQHKDRAIDLANRFLNDLMDIGHTDAPIKMVGRSCVIYIHPGPDKARIKKRKEEEQQKDAENGSELKDS